MRDHQEKHNVDAETRPIDAFSKTPIREHAGYYVEGGMSPFEIEAQRPVVEFLSERESGEDFDDYIHRRTNDPRAVTKLFFDGLVTPVELEHLINEAEAAQVEKKKIGHKLLHLFN